MSGKAERIGTIRTWHRRIALVLGLFVVFQGLTGAISQYRFWLLGAAQAGYAAPADGAPAEPGAVVAMVEAQLDGFATAHVMYPAANAPDTAVMVMGGYSPDERMSRMVTFDQYRGRVISDTALRESAGWIGLANTLHKWTIFGTTGRIILTLVGLGTAVFAALGIWLYVLTRRARPASALVRWHRLAGLVVGAVLLPVALSGTMLNLYGWAEEGADVKVTAMNMREGMARGDAGAPAVGVGEAYQRAIAAIGPQDLAAFAPAGPHARYHWFAFNSKQLRRTDVLVDPDDGSIAGIKPSGLMEGGEGLRHWLFPVHSLYLVGPVGGAIATVVGLSLLFWLVSGVIMWLRGRRRRRAVA